MFLCFYPFSIVKLYPYFSCKSCKIIISGTNLEPEKSSLQHIDAYSYCKIKVCRLFIESISNRLLVIDYERAWILNKINALYSSNFL